MATSTVPVDPMNAGQLGAWDGDEGAYWAAHADHFERALAAYQPQFLDAAAIRMTDRVLDLGCGTGGITRAAAHRAAQGAALGVDLSSAMLAVARERAAAEGLTNASFLQADAQIHAFEAGAFDVALGQTSAMFFGDRVAALANVARALGADGRLALVTWQPFDRNEWIREFSIAMAAGRDLPTPPPDAPGPFTLSDPAVITGVLGAAGYAEVVVAPATGPMWFGADADDAYNVVAGLLGWMLDGLDAAGEARARDALRTSVEAHAGPDGVVYDSAVWISTATKA